MLTDRRWEGIRRILLLLLLEAPSVPVVAGQLVYAGTQDEDYEGRPIPPEKDRRVVVMRFPNRMKQD